MIIALAWITISSAWADDTLVFNPFTNELDFTSDITLSGGSCSTTNGVAYFNGSTSIACDADFVFDGTVVSLGDATPDGLRLDVDVSTTVTSGTVSGVHSVLSVSPASGSTADYRGVFLQPTITTAQTFTSDYVAGLYVYPKFNNNQAATFTGAASGSEKGVFGGIFKTDIEDATVQKSVGLYVTNADIDDGNVTEADIGIEISEGSYTGTGRPANIAKLRFTRSCENTADYTNSCVAISMEGNQNVIGIDDGQNLLLTPLDNPQNVLLAFDLVGTDNLYQILDGRLKVGHDIGTLAANTPWSVITPDGILEVELLNDTAATPLSVFTATYNLGTSATASAMSASITVEDSANIAGGFGITSFDLTATDSAEQTTTLSNPAVLDGLKSTVVGVGDVAGHYVTSRAFLGTAFNINATSGTQNQDSTALRAVQGGMALSGTAAGTYNAFGIHLPGSTCVDLSGGATTTNCALLRVEADTLVSGMDRNYWLDSVNTREALLTGGLDIGSTGNANGWTYTNTTTDAITLTATALTSGSALVITGPSGVTSGMSDELLRTSTDCQAVTAAFPISEGCIKFAAVIDTTASAVDPAHVVITTTNSPATNANIAYSFATILNDATSLGNTLTNGYFYANASGNVAATKTVYGVYSDTTNDNITTDQGTRDTYAFYGSAVGTTRGTATTYGAYLSATGADSNWALHADDGYAIFDQAIGVGTNQSGLLVPEGDLEVEGANGANASIVIDADRGDQNTDTWVLRATASDNDFDLINHTNIRFTVASGGGFTVPSTAEASAMTFSGTTTDQLTLTATALTSGSALQVDGPSSGVGQTAGLLALTSYVDGTLPLAPEGSFPSVIRINATFGEDTSSHVGSALSSKSTMDNSADSIFYGLSSLVVDDDSTNNTLIGVRGIIDADGSTGSGSSSKYGGYFSTLSTTTGTTTAYGVYASASGADTNIGLHVDNGVANLDGAVTLGDTIVSTRTTDLGWTVQVAANQACTTTCTSAAVFGQDVDDANKILVGPSDASADRCVCAGSS